ncbi:DP-EP family protein [Paraglaciecola marina]|uniref:DP-EP family protein n=1 Tax=Paraglaciecola marina TaxID=2500157 RepID=UPI0010620136|nr:DP-EP family protein [Paraglaciecola marina]
MFPKIITTRTRVYTDEDDNNPVVQFYNSQDDTWEKDITLDFNRAGIAVFTLNMDPQKEKYIFFGALQKTECGSSPDTNWDFKINVAGNTISFNNDCKNEQQIDIKLTLIPRDSEEVEDVLISADPRLRNQPD